MAQLTKWATDELRKITDADLRDLALYNLTVDFCPVCARRHEDLKAGRVLVDELSDFGRFVKVYFVCPENGGEILVECRAWVTPDGSNG